MVSSGKYTDTVASRIKSSAKVSPVESVLMPSRLDYREGFLVFGGVYNSILLYTFPSHIKIPAESYRTPQPMLPMTLILITSNYLQIFVSFVISSR